jgi:hypothetical protein
LCAGGDDNGSFLGNPRAATTQTQKESIVDELAQIEVEVEVDESEEDACVYAWRVEQLSGLGLSQMIASAVASFVDWHEVARLVERGCSPELALEIVR